MARERFKVAVVVLVDCEGVDERDASNVAQVAVRAAITGDALASMPVEVAIPLRKAVDRTVRVIDVMDLGVAAGNGYLWTSPTSRAWRDVGIDPARGPVGANQNGEGE
jgi:hypothetical protein